LVKDRNCIITCSPLASLGENAAVEQELLFPFAPLRENKEFETDALWALLNCRMQRCAIIYSDNYFI